jgi:hypothetical protein
VSDGVAAMRMFSTTSAVAKEALMTDDIPQSEMSFRPPSSKPGTIDGIKNRPRPRRQKAVSTGVFMMQSEKSATMLHENRKGDDLFGLHKNTNLSNQETKQENSSILKPVPPLSPIGALGNRLFSQKEQDEGNLPMALRQKKIITPIAEEGNESSDSEDSVTSVVSEGVPDVVLPHCAEETKIFDFAELLRDIYMKKSYRLFSSVFGTMVAFFMIAIRIELILFDICAITGKDSKYVTSSVTHIIAIPCCSLLNLRNAQIIKTLGI